MVDELLRIVKAMEGHILFVNIVVVALLSGMTLALSRIHGQDSAKEGALLRWTALGWLLNLGYLVLEFDRRLLYPDQVGECPLLEHPWFLIPLAILDLVSVGCVLYGSLEFMRPDWDRRLTGGLVLFLGAAVLAIQCSTTDREWLPFLIVPSSLFTATAWLVFRWGMLNLVQNDLEPRCFSRRLISWGLISYCGVQFVFIPFPGGQGAQVFHDRVIAVGFLVASLAKLALLTGLAAYTVRRFLRLQDLEREQHKITLHREKMALLGTLVAGLAHELKNPAFSLGDTARKLRGLIPEIREVHRNLVRGGLSDAEWDRLAELDQRIERQHPFRSLLGSEGENALMGELKQWLGRQGYGGGNRLAGYLLTSGLPPGDWESQLAVFPAQARGIILRWAGASYQLFAFLEVLELSAKQIGKIIDIIRKSTDNRPAAPEPVNVNAAIDAAWAIVKGKIGKQLDPVWSLRPDLPAALGYESDLISVFINLMVNAADAMDGRRGTLEITTRQDGDELQLQFADNGKGVKAEDRSKLFHPFYTTKPLGEGTGLGLAMSAMIVEQHKGRFATDFETGRTVFTVILPVAPAKP